MEGTQCPNCGQRMVPFRRDRQRAGRRTITLLWSMCEGCRHVGLTSWQYDDTPAGEPVIEIERVPRKQQTPQGKDEQMRSLQHIRLSAD